MSKFAVILTLMVIDAGSVSWFLVELIRLWRAS